jgi:hypothetical protein
MEPFDGVCGPAIAPPLPVEDVDAVVGGVG